MTAIAETAQRALLRVMPASIGSLGFAARYVSATEEALVGGDLYEVAETPNGVRVIVGDARGKGLEAVQMAATVLAAFRHAAVKEPTLTAVATDLDDVVTAVAEDEDFVTAVLAEFHDDHTVTLLNCGHHPPLLLANAHHRRPGGHRVARAATRPRPGAKPGHVPAGRWCAAAVLHRRPGRESQPPGNLLPPRGQRRGAKYGRSRDGAGWIARPRRRPRRTSASTTTWPWCSSSARMGTKGPAG